ncbi:MAG TPA: hypothetical protein VG870_01715 [Chitinophagaceae bacterium]|nr:hypothetical protein [Chitinophagaceae bacterium]
MIHPQLTLPRQLDNRYAGRRISLYLFYPIAAMTITRSLIHMFAPDGGAQRIATIPLDHYSPQAAATIIFLFALRGLSQGILSLLYLLALWFYRSLVPLLYLLLVLEYGLRILAGHLHPIHTAGTAPGEVLNYIMVPLALVLYLLSIDLPARGRAGDTTKNNPHP